MGDVFDMCYDLWVMIDCSPFFDSLLWVLL